MNLRVGKEIQMKYHVTGIMFILSFLIITITCLRASADASFLSTGRYLSTAFQDDILDFQNEKISFLKNTSSRTPFLNEVEFRMKIDEFESNKQRYAVRLKPNGWGEAENSRKVHDKTVQYNKTHYDFLVNQALKERYDIIIDYLHNRQIISLNEELMVVYEDRVSVLKQSVDTVNFNPNDLLDAENDVIRLELDLIALKNDTVTIEGEILRNLPGADAIAFDISGMIGIPAIKNIIAGTDLGERQNIHLEDTRQDAALSEAEYELEKSENRKFLSFIEAAYDTDEQDDVEEAFSIQFGISIPFGNPNRPDINRRKLSSLKAQSAYAIRQKEVREDSALLSRDVNRLISQYTLLKAKKTRSNTRASFHAYQRMEGVSPLILLKLKESLLKTDIVMQKINRRIYEKYIQFLDISGKLSEKPYKNYLSGNLERIRP
jgi:hypothetical protein